MAKTKKQNRRKKRRKNKELQGPPQTLEAYEAKKHYEEGKHRLIEEAYGTEELEATDFTNETLHAQMKFFERFQIAILEKIIAVNEALAGVTTASNTPEKNLETTHSVADQGARVEDSKAVDDFRKSRDVRNPAELSPEKKSQYIEALEAHVTSGKVRNVVINNDTLKTIYDTALSGQSYAAVLDDSYYKITQSKARWIEKRRNATSRKARQEAEKQINQLAKLEVKADNARRTAGAMHPNLKVPSGSFVKDIKVEGSSIGDPTNIDFGVPYYQGSDEVKPRPHDRIRGYSPNIDAIQAERDAPLWTSVGESSLSATEAALRTFQQTNPIKSLEDPRRGFTKDINLSGDVISPIEQESSARFTTPGELTRYFETVPLDDSLLANIIWMSQTAYDKDSVGHVKGLKFQTGQTTTESRRASAVLNRMPEPFEFDGITERITDLLEQTRTGNRGQKNLAKNELFQIYSKVSGIKRGTKITNKSSAPAIVSAIKKIRLLQYYEDAFAALKESGLVDALTRIEGVTEITGRTGDKVQSRKRTKKRLSGADIRSAMASLDKDNAKIALDAINRIASATSDMNKDALKEARVSMYPNFKTDKTDSRVKDLYEAIRNNQEILPKQTSSQAARAGVTEIKRLAGPPVKDLKRRIDAGEQSADLFYEYGDALDVAGKEKQARAYYEKALSLEPNHAKSQLALDVLGVDVKARSQVKSYVAPEPTVWSAPVPSQTFGELRQPPVDPIRAQQKAENEAYWAAVDAGEVPGVEKYRESKSPSDLGLPSQDPSPLESSDPLKSLPLEGFGVGTGGQIIESKVQPQLRQPPSYTQGWVPTQPTPSASGEHPKAYLYHDAMSDRVRNLIRSNVVREEPPRQLIAKTFNDLEKLSGRQLVLLHQHMVGADQTIKTLGGSPGEYFSNSAEQRMNLINEIMQVQFMNRETWEQLQVKPATTTPKKTPVEVDLATETEGEGLAAEVFSESELKSQTVKQLKELAKQKQIPGRSKLRKTGLIAALLRTQHGETTAKPSATAAQAAPAPTTQPKVVPPPTDPTPTVQQPLDFGEEDTTVGDVVATGDTAITPEVDLTPMTEASDDAAIDQFSGEVDNEKIIRLLSGETDPVTEQKVPDEAWELSKFIENNGQTVNPFASLEELRQQAEQINQAEQPITAASDDAAIDQFSGEVDNEEIIRLLSGQPEGDVFPTDPTAEQGMPIQATQEQEASYEGDNVEERGLIPHPEMGGPQLVITDDAGQEVASEPELVDQVNAVLKGMGIDPITAPEIADSIDDTAQVADPDQAEKKSKIKTAVDKVTTVYGGIVWPVKAAWKAGGAVKEGGKWVVRKGWDNTVVPGYKAGKYVNRQMAKVPGLRAAVGTVGVGDVAEAWHGITETREANIRPAAANRDIYLDQHNFKSYSDLTNYMVQNQMIDQEEANELNRISGYISRDVRAGKVASPKDHPYYFRLQDKLNKATQDPTAHYGRTARVMAPVDTDDVRTRDWYIQTKGKTATGFESPITIRSPENNRAGDRLFKMPWLSEYQQSAVSAGRIGDMIQHNLGLMAGMTTSKAATEALMKKLTSKIGGKIAKKGIQGAIVGTTGAIVTAPISAGYLSEELAAMMDPDAEGWRKWTREVAGVAPLESLPRYTSVRMRPRAYEKYKQLLDERPVTSENQQEHLKALYNGAPYSDVTIWKLVTTDKEGLPLRKNQYYLKNNYTDMTKPVSQVEPDIPGYVEKYNGEVARVTSLALLKDLKQADENLKEFNITWDEIEKAEKEIMAMPSFSDDELLGYDKRSKRDRGFSSSILEATGLGTPLEVGGWDINPLSHAQDLAEWGERHDFGEAKREGRERVMTFFPEMSDGKRKRPAKVEPFIPGNVFTGFGRGVHRTLGMESDYNLYSDNYMDVSQDPSWWESPEETERRIKEFIGSQ